MTFDEFKTNISLEFPQDRGEDDKAYQFFLRESLEPFRNRGELSNVWERVKLYDGNTKRPKFAFFYAIAQGTERSSSLGFIWYKCKCGEKLSEKSGGACPSCKRTDAEMVISNKPVQVLACQAACFDCSIYGDMAIGPSCGDYGTPRFETCKDRGRCKCVTCCRYEYLRTYHPDRVRQGYDQAIKALPRSISEASKAFQDGRASMPDITTFLSKRKGLSK